MQVGDGGGAPCCALRVEGECVVKIAGLGSKVESIIVENLKNAYRRLPLIIDEWMSVRHLHIADMSPIPVGSPMSGRAPASTAPPLQSQHSSGSFGSFHSADSELDSPPGSDAEAQGDSVGPTPILDAEVDEWRKPRGRERVTLQKTHTIPESELAPFHHLQGKSHKEHHAHLKENPKPEVRDLVKERDWRLRNGHTHPGKSVTLVEDVAQVETIFSERLVLLQLADDGELPPGVVRGSAPDGALRFSARVPTDAPSSFSVCLSVRVSE